MPMNVGVIGMGIMGEPMARNLLKSGKFGTVTVWNRTSSKCDALAAEGASVAPTAAAVIAASDITFGMLADPAAALAVAEGPDGVGAGIKANPGKAYVDVSTVDEQTSQKIAALVVSSGGRFLEAPVSGSKKPAIDGTLIFLCAGDEALYNECKEALSIMGKSDVYLGAVGAGARMKLVVNMIMGGMMCALSEGMALADKAELSQEALLSVLNQGALANGLIAVKGPAMMSGQFPPAFPLKHQQKDMRLALELGEQLKQGLPVAEAADKEFRDAMGDGHADEDFAAVYTTVAKQ